MRRPSRPSCCRSGVSLVLAAADLVIPVDGGRGVVSGLILSGQAMDRGVRVPPKCAATSLVLLKGVSMAQAQPTAKWL